MIYVPVMNLGFRTASPKGILPIQDRVAFVPYNVQ